MKEQEKDSVIFREIERITRPGRKVANAFQGKLSPDFINETFKGIKLSPETIIKRLEDFFQPARKLQEVVVPYFSGFFKLISTKEPVIYKGVSFNPLITTFGENVNLLDFYSWIKNAGTKGIVLDASFYAIINAAKQSPIESFSSKAAEEVVKFLQKTKGKYPEIKEAANIREKYLRAIAISLFAPKEAPLIISAEEIWESTKYIECLQEAIKFCAKNPREKEPIEIIRYANYERYNTEYQRWYTVLVLAEVLYLNRVYGVNIKLGPTSESNFDTVINDFMKKLEIPFGFVWYNREIEKKIPYPERLFFNDEENEIRRKLQNHLLKEWIEEILAPFTEGDLIATTLSVIRKVRESAEKKLPRLKAEGGWFMEFPPGECD